MATAKQLLQYVANRGTEQDAGRILNASGIKFKDSANLFSVNGDGALVNSDGQSVNFGMGQVTGFLLPGAPETVDEDEQTDGGRQANGLNAGGELSKPPAGLKTDGPMASDSAPGAPVAPSVTTATQIGARETKATTPAAGGARQAVAAVPNPEAGLKAAAVGGTPVSPPK